MKRTLGILLVLVVLTTAFAANALAGTVTVDKSKTEGSIAYINGMQITSPNDELFMKGIVDQLSTWGDFNIIDMSPAEQKADQQIAKIQEAVALGFKMIIMTPTSATGYDAVLRQAKAAGVKIISYNSLLNPDYRTVHVAQVEPYQFS